MKTKNKDIYEWLDVRSQYPHLKKKLRAKLIEMIKRVTSEFDSNNLEERKQGNHRTFDPIKSKGILQR